VEYGGTSVAKGVFARLDHYDRYVGNGNTTVHPVQLSNVVGPDFVGWGTVRGRGTFDEDGNHISDCPNNYTAGWHLYADGKQFGQYWCRTGYGTVGAAAKDQEFKIRFGTCPTTGLDRFVFFHNNEVQTCALTEYSYGTIAVGGESVYADPPVMEIDIDYEGLSVYFSSGWYSWADTTNTECDSDTFGPDPYEVLRLSSTKYRITDGDFQP
jgi:hypothetical protein